MKSRLRLWPATLLLLPAFACAEEPAATATAIADAPAQSTPAAVSFDLKHASVQEILRSAAARQGESDSREDSGAMPADDTASLTARLGALEFRAPRRAHHTDCDSFDCVTYTADGVPLFSFPRDQMIHASGDHQDSWLACQSGDDMLSTFERYDQCRGVDIGLPPKAVNGVELKLPKLSLGN